MMRRVVIAALALALSSCGTVARVQSPISFSADRRLKMLSPTDSDHVALPLTLRWRYRGALADGRHFAVFVDRPPVAAGQKLRLRYCTFKESQPVLPGEERPECHDDRLRVFQTNEPTVTLACVDQRKHVPESKQNTHTATVVVLDRDGERVGRAATKATFEVDERSAKQCPVITD